jgi:hypothetical protein
MQAQTHTRMLLNRNNKSFGDIVSVLKGERTKLLPLPLISRTHLRAWPVTELRDTISSDAEIENADDGQEEVQPDKVMILDALIAFCQQL